MNKSKIVTPSEMWRLLELIEKGTTESGDKKTPDGYVRLES